ncbi:MAG: UDP-glucose 4-epimerase GalE [Flavobacteriales bacterium]|nr:UDP-glucose 4-epimerase GalE [Flavobacteriales bacterium]
MEQNKTKVLVTGGAGYIGSHTIIELLGAWKGDVVAVDHFGNSSPAVFDRIERITGRRVRNHAVDLCDAAAVERVFAAEGDIAGVIHFAAYKSVPESVGDPDKYYRNNIISLLNMLRACTAHGVQNFIFSSSCSVYGNIASLPVGEDTPMGHAESPYAYTKQIGERIVDDHVRVDPRMRAISLRYFNPAGAHVSGLNGEDPINAPSSLVPVITRTASGRMPVMHVHGTDYPTRDGSCIRDYVHVSDIADAHILALQRTFGSAMDTRHEVINLGTGNGVSVLEAIAAFEHVSGRPLNYEKGPRRAGDVVAVYSDTTRSGRLLGWKARRDLHEMMRSAWAWEQHCMGRTT